MISFHEKWRGEQERSIFVPKGEKPKTQRQFFYRHYYEYIRGLVEKLPADAKILEVGCGRGTICQYLREYDKRHNFYLVDNSQDALDLARENLGGTPYVYLAEAEELPFDDESFDLVLSMGVVEHVGDPQRFYKEQFRVLKKGGICFSFNIPHKFSAQALNIFGQDSYHRTDTTKEEYVKILRDVGFVVTERFHVNPFPLFTPIPRSWERIITLLYRAIYAIRSLWFKYPLRGSKWLSQAHFIVARRPAPHKAKKAAKGAKPKVKKCYQTRKVCFTREEAEQRKEELKKQTQDKFLRIYCCEFCMWWHLTHKRRHRW